MNCSFPSLLIGLALLAKGMPAAAASIVLNPDKDNTIIQVADPLAQLSNGTGDIFVGRTNQDGSGPAVTSIRRGLIHFNVAGSLPAGATITGVSLSIRNVMPNNGDQTLTLQLVLQDWGQGTSFFAGGVGAPATNNDATWYYTFYNFSNPSASPTWTTAGGTFSPSVSASAVDPGGSTGNIVTWTSAQLIADVQNWLNNPASNFGWGILGNETTGQTAKRLNSSETTTPPTLTITYTVPEPSTAVMGVVAAAGILFLSTRRRDDD